MKKQFLSIKKIVLIISLIIGIIGFFNFSQNVFATNFNIANALDISFPGNTLFEANNLSPGQEVGKTITITNNGIYPHSFSIAINGISNDLANILQIEPRINGAPIWNKTLSQIAKNPDTDVIISAIQPGETIYLDMMAIFPSSAGNEYMNSSIPSISFYVGNESTDTPEPDSQDTQSSSSSSSGSSGGDSFLAFGGRSLSSSDSQDKEKSGEDEDQKEGEKIDVSSDEKSVKGVEDESESKKCWGILLLLIFAICLAICGWYSKINKQTYLRILPIVVAVIFYILHKIINQGVQDALFCRWFILFEIILLISFYILKSLFVDKD